MKHMPKFAAAVLILAAIGAAAAWLTLGHGGATVAWADVQQHLLALRTMTCRMTITQPGAPAMEMKMLLKEPGLMRQEMTAPTQAFTIIDMSQMRVLALSPTGKTAVVIDMTGMPEEMLKQQQEQNFLDGMKKLVQESEAPLGEREIDGRRTLGYEVVQGRQKMQVWADAETGEPIEMTMDAFSGEAKITMYDFTFDEELDDSLFSMEIPEGYELMQQTMDIKPAGSEDVIWLLELLANARDGTFPDGLTPQAFMKDVQAYAKQKRLQRHKQDSQQDEMAEAMQMGQSFAQVLVMLQMHPEAVYAGKGVQLGDAETPVLWYKPEKDKDSWTIIYGDLSIEADVAEEDLPEPPVEEPADAADESAPAGLLSSDDVARGVDVFADSTIRVQMIDGDGSNMSCGSKVPATIEIQPGEKAGSVCFAFSNGSRIPAKLPVKVLVIRHADARTLREVEVTGPGGVIQVTAAGTAGEPDALAVTVDGR